jgi:hypothetical protein
MIVRLYASALVLLCSSIKKLNKLAKKASQKLTIIKPYSWKSTIAALPVVSNVTNESKDQKQREQQRSHGNTSQISEWKGFLKF